MGPDSIEGCTHLIEHYALYQFQEAGGVRSEPLIITDTNNLKEWSVKSPPIIHLDGRDVYDEGFSPSHWTEMNLFESDDCPYVIEKRGMSRVDGEINYSSISGATSVISVWDKLRIKSSEGKIYSTIIADVLFYRLVRLKMSDAEWCSMIKMLSQRSDSMESRSAVSDINESYHRGETHSSRFR